MTYPTPLLRLVASGALFNIENWSFGLHLAPDGSGPATPPDRVTDGVADAVSAFVQSACTATARLGSIKLNALNAEGRYASRTKTVERVWEGTSGPQGAGTGGTFPPQISMAITLRTPVRRGLASTGRIFLPSPAVRVGSSGTTTDTDADAIAQRMVTLLNALPAAVPGWAPVVASGLREGAARPITGVSAGLVLDTIRSRRAKMVEAHTAPRPTSYGFAGGGGGF